MDDAYANALLAADRANALADYFNSVGEHAYADLVFDIFVPADIAAGLISMEIHDVAEV